MKDAANPCPEGQGFCREEPMRIEFEDNSSVEIKLGSPGKIAIILSARDADNSLKIQINSCEIPIKQFAEIVRSLGVTL